MRKFPLWRVEAILFPSCYSSLGLLVIRIKACGPRSLDFARSTWQDPMTFTLASTPPLEHSFSGPHCGDLSYMRNVNGRMFGCVKLTINHNRNQK